jgi:hypothetical protein
LLTATRAPCRALCGLLRHGCRRWV